MRAWFVSNNWLMKRSVRVSDSLKEYQPIYFSIKTPFLEISETVHRLRLKQQGRRIPDSSLEQATSILLLRVSVLFVDLIQRSHSQCALGVSSCHNFSAGGTVINPAKISVGISGSGHSVVGSITNLTESLTVIPANWGIFSFHPSQ